MAVSSDYASVVLATYYREKSGYDFMPQFKSSDELRAYWEKSTPGWWAKFRDALASTGLTFTQANEAVKLAAAQGGVNYPSTPKILFDELYAKSKDTRFSRAWSELTGSAAKKVVAVSKATEETVEAGLKAASTVIKTGPYLYAAAGIGMMLLVAWRMSGRKTV